jgi:voltage-gated potassium channel
MSKARHAKPDSGWRRTLYIVIIEADTPMGQAFDVLLLISICISVVAVSLDSVNSVAVHHGEALSVAEWFFTLLFTVEYLVRLVCTNRPGLYARSFFGIVDLLAVVPTYVSIFLPGSQYLLVIRVLRVLRIFRVLKLVKYLGEAEMLVRAMKASSRKILVFLFAVGTLVVIFGSVMYLIEGEENGFTSIPKGIYWAIVTLTTVGFGDISPQTDLGQAVAAMIMVLGYGIIVVPAGIASFELSRGAGGGQAALRTCDSCGGSGHNEDALYCKHCGESLSA